ncbi:MAG: alpha/beta hydrolase [Candidatus Eisenbacteria bacterium]|nr:alpha/beta hydrolase [Candidatus Eisenbacteria bacterium]
MQATGDISVREKGSGGVTAEARDAPRNWMQGRRHVVLLVHGYNADMDGARRSFDAFLRMLPARFPPAGRVYWPGDADWGVFSALAYPSKIPVARASAGRLAAYLSKLRGPGGGPIELTLVGHSLGCRVILELLEDLSWLDDTRCVVRVVVLMAAAVPTDLVGVGGQLRRSGLGPLHRHVYHSDDDRVLRWAFPAGQSMAQLAGSEPGDSLEAVGLHGNPRSYASRRRDLRGNRHSDYWKDRRAVRELATLMGSAIPRVLEPRTLPAAPLPEMGPPVRRPGFTRELPTRPVTP